MNTFKAKSNLGNANLSKQASNVATKALNVGTDLKNKMD